MEAGSSKHASNLSSKFSFLPAKILIASLLSIKFLSFLSSKVFFEIK